MSELIPPEFTGFVENEVASGSYRSAAEVVAEGLRLLREQKLYELRKDIDAGLAQIDRGEGIRVDSPEALDRFFDEIRNRAALRLQEGQARQ
jgi:antitoxin ParD1/3/4